MNANELTVLNEIASALDPGLFIFWCYPDASHPLSYALLMRARSTPCTPAGDVLANITEMKPHEVLRLLTDECEKTGIAERFGGLGFEISSETLREIVETVWRPRIRNREIAE